ncbi:hypothetical protein DRP07_12650 [Archaeoglobales archaeon]|nr:MAG: hypothetical protein DRP07_12650 [Archaeoglobales archaeon]
MEKQKVRKRRNDGRYQMLGVYPWPGEAERWKRYAKEVCGQSLSDFMRDAANTYIRFLDGQLSLAETNIDEIERLEKENEELRLEIERLKEEIELLRAIQPEEKDDFFDRVWNAISRKKYKKVDQILLDAGVVTPISSKEDWLQAYDKFMDELRELEERCRQEGKQFPLEFKEGRGWRKRRP